MMKRVAFIVALVAVFAFAGMAHAQHKVFLEENGLLVIEAEDFVAMHRDPLGIYYWEVEAEVEGYSGTGYAISGPNIGGVSGRWDDQRAYVEYKVRITTPGVYHVLYRGYEKLNHGNSSFVSVNDIPPNARVTCSHREIWRICYGDDNGDAAVTFDLPAGDHIVKLWIRETGEAVDQIYLMIDPGPEWAPRPRTHEPLPAKFVIE